MISKVPHIHSLETHYQCTLLTTVLDDIKGTMHIHTLETHYQCTITTQLIDIPALHTLIMSLIFLNYVNH